MSAPLSAGGNPGNRPRFSRADIPRMAGLALTYALLARLVLTLPTANGNATVFWLPGGMALAALLVWGRRLWPGVFLGALATQLLVGDPLWPSALIALGNTLESLLGARLLERCEGFNRELEAPGDFITLGRVAAVSAAVSALVGPCALLAFGSGSLALRDVAGNILHWWQADTLGILLGTSLLLVWRQWPSDWFRRGRLPATLGLFAIAFLVGQAVFLDWCPGLLSSVALSYWVFLFVITAAASHGRHGALLIASMTALQALSGASRGIGYFGADLEHTGLQNFWFYLLIVTITGLSLALRIEQLKKGEARFRAIIDASPIPYALNDERGNITDLNPAFIRTFGYTRSDIPALAEWWPRAYPDPAYRTWVAETWQAKLEEARRTGRPFESVELKIICKDGSTRTCVVSAASLGEGFEGTYLVILYDITERQRAESALRDSEKRYRHISSLTSDMLYSGCRADDGGLQIQWIGGNPEQVFGYGAEELMRRGSWQEFVVAEDLPVFAGHVTDLRPGQSSEAVLRAEHRDGSVHYLQSHALVDDESCGEASRRIFGALRDITERKEMESALRTSEERFRAMRDLLPEQVWTAGPDGRLDYVNQRVLDFFGLPFDAMIEDSWQFCVHPEDLPKTIERWSASLQAGSPYETEFRLRHHSGEYRWCIARARPAHDEHGRIVKWYGTNTDITERRRVEEALRNSELMLKTVLGSTQDGIAVADAETLRFRFCNEAFCRMIGYSRDELRNLSVPDLRDPKNMPAVRAVIEEVKRGRADLIPEMPMERRDGSIFLADVSPGLLELEGRPHVMGFFRDVTERKRAEEKLRLIARVFETTLEGIVVTDAERRIIEVNGAFTQITGYSRKEVLGRNPRILKSGRHASEFYTEIWNAVNGTGHWSGEIWNRRKDGTVYAEWTTISAITDDKGAVTHYVGISSDITLLKDHEKQLEHIAHYDSLTGIPNRVLLRDRMRQALAQTRREANSLAVCYLDIDGFKPINDTLGHEAGDRVLIEIAKRIGLSLRGGDTVARLGGDEFVVLVAGIESIADCRSGLDRLLDAIAQPIFIENRQFTVTASIGAALYPSDAEDPDLLLRHADQAMYLAKQSGKNRYHIFDPRHDERVRVSHKQRTRIEEGFLAREFELFYQPKVAMRTRRVMGFEALIRWRHPERGILAPAEFLPLIENTELEIRVGEWVIDTALAQLETWRREELELGVSVNIAAAHLQSGGFVGKLRQQTARYPGLKPGQLQIEILETAALADIAAVNGIIEDCAALGVSFSLDDFGTGYSSLSYLRKLPADTLKIDQSFVRDMLVDQGDHTIVQGVIALARAFDRTTVAEGVETAGHFRALEKMGCDLGQGYGIARPMPAEETVRWCRAFSPGLLIPDETGGTREP